MKLYVKPIRTKSGLIRCQVDYGERHYVISRILADGRGNAKLAKSSGIEVISVGLSLAPHKSSGVTDVCEFASPVCRSMCLHYKGRADAVGKNVARKIHLGRSARTAFWFRHPNEFSEMVGRELSLTLNRAERQDAVVGFRPNIFSDIDWLFWSPDWFGHERLRAYGYTKDARQYERFLSGDNRIHLTFSRSERNHRQSLEFLHRGGSVAVVFKDKLPSKWHGFDVIDGTSHDMRFLDPPNVVVGLKFKARRGANRQAEIDKAIASGFVIDSLAESRRKASIYV